MSNSLSKIVAGGIVPQAAYYISGDTAANLTATGATQATGFVMSANYNLFTTVAASAGAVLPAVLSPPSNGVVVGDEIHVFNNGANSLTVYPPLGSQIALGAINAGVQVVSGKSAKFVMLTPTIWGVLQSA
jgi:hypothetical protein